MARQPVPRPPAGGDWGKFDPSNPAHVEALKVADPDQLWIGGHHVLAMALDPLTEFKHVSPTLSFNQLLEADRLRGALGISDPDLT